MLTEFPDELLSTAQGQEANRILRTCVHCGFCTANCPTYRLLGDELDSPRGRIYLIKGFLEGKRASLKTLQHLDRCLTCRACETYCPSGVEYGHLLDIGREKLEQQLKRPLLDQFSRFLLRLVIPNRKLFALLVACGQLFKPVLPGFLKSKIPARVKCSTYQPESHARKMILIAGCVQPAISPGINESAKRVLDKLAITAIELKEERCCGALNHHMAASVSAEKMMKHNIDCWWPMLDANIEAIISTTSGCGAVIKEYGYLLRHDEAYADKANKISNMTRDIAEVMENEISSAFIRDLRIPDKKIAFQSPCTLQHGQGLNGSVERLLTRCGFALGKVMESQLCCGSAGVYSLLQPKIATQLRNQKLDALLMDSPDIIATANIGCQHHLQQATDVRVRHWIEILAETIPD